MAALDGRTDPIDAARRTSELLEQRPSKPTLRAGSVTVHAGVPGVSGEVRFARAADSQEDPTPALRPALTGLLGLAGARDSGVVLTLDEAMARSCVSRSRAWTRSDAHADRKMRGR